jgi:hypothetical protein
MIERIADMPDRTIGFAFSGEVTRSDYEETLIPPIREAIENEEKIRCLCVLGPEFDGYEAGAVWEDLKTGARYGFGHLSSWQRMALVTDVEWVRHATALFGWMAPGELKLFGNDQLDDAKEWVAA